MFGTRAHWIVDFAMLTTCLAPVAVLIGVRTLRWSGWRAHRSVQLSALSVCVLAVLALEGHIRLSGGSGSLTAQSPHAGSTLLTCAAWIHIGGAVLTYSLWIALAWTSARRQDARFSAAFARFHRRAGWAILAGLTFTLVSAWVVYGLTFT